LVDLIETANTRDLAALGEIVRHERLVESFGRLLTAFPDARIDLEWVTTEGDRAVGWAHITGTHSGPWRSLPATHRPIDVHGMLAVQVADDGSVTDFWLANDWLSIALQIGVPLTLGGPVSSAE